MAGEPINRLEKTHLQRPRVEKLGVFKWFSVADVMPKVPVDRKGRKGEVGWTTDTILGN